MTNHHSRFDRYLRIMKRTRTFLKFVNNRSDQICKESETWRSPDAEKKYLTAKRLILDIEKELRHL